ncbi:hypothetical protein BDK51DRAFT_49078 [Blyttiomyces helicus]|uniref:Protein kinase domain-containing protein n=1 Tax=Blyttiomyces helicus TaxID=388810 RepID=A0A4V1IRY2_9FUNG|nr:hypothetical protein BDK51DRAFT_49078 [Blyttiomyces helicus]|eukprot:RKO91647.1 hypothetical protein BDK51DRAFT_49078 [Blyttiomyces helicus]
MVGKSQLLHAPLPLPRMLRGIRQAPRPGARAPGAYRYPADTGRSLRAAASTGATALAAVSAERKGRKRQRETRVRNFVAAHNPSADEGGVEAAINANIAVETRWSTRVISVRALVDLLSSETINQMQNGNGGEGDAPRPAALVVSNAPEPGKPITDTIAIENGSDGIFETLMDEIAQSEQAEVTSPPPTGWVTIAAGEGQYSPISPFEELGISPVSRPEASDGRSSVSGGTEAVSLATDKIDGLFTYLGKMEFTGEGPGEQQGRGNETTGVGRTDAEKVGRSSSPVEHDIAEGTISDSEWDDGPSPLRSKSSLAPLPPPPPPPPPPPSRAHIPIRQPHPIESDSEWLDDPAPLPTIQDTLAPPPMKEQVPVGGASVKSEELNTILGAHSAVIQSTPVEGTMSDSAWDDGPGTLSGFTSPAPSAAPPPPPPPPPPLPPPPPPTHVPFWQSHLIEPEGVDESEWLDDPAPFPTLQRILPPPPFPEQVPAVVEENMEPTKPVTVISSDLALPQVAPSFVPPFPLGIIGRRRDDDEDGEVDASEWDDDAPPSNKVNEDASPAHFPTPPPAPIAAGIASQIRDVASFLDVEDAIVPESEAGYSGIDWNATIVKQREVRKGSTVTNSLEEETEQEADESASDPTRPPSIPAKTPALAPLRPLLEHADSGASISKRISTRLAKNRKFIDGSESMLWDETASVTDLGRDLDPMPLHPLDVTHGEARYSSTSGSEVSPRSSLASPLEMYDGSKIVGHPRGSTSSEGLHRDVDGEAGAADGGVSRAGGLPGDKLGGSYGSLASVSSCKTGGVDGGAGAGERDSQESGSRGSLARHSRLSRTSRRTSRTSKVVRQEEDIDSSIFPQELLLEFTVLGILGSAYANVHEVCSKKTGERFAMKLIYKERVLNKARLMSEIEAVKRAKHRNIVTCHACFVTDTHIFLILDLADGGCLFDRMLEVDLTEHECALISRRVLEAIAYLHSIGIVHRDIKTLMRRRVAPFNQCCWQLENVLMTSKTVNTELKLADFGVVNIVEEDLARGRGQRLARFNSFVGSVAYLAPEKYPGMTSFAGKPYDESVDVWAFGVMLYMLMSLASPFGNDEADESAEPAQIERIIKAEFDFSEPGSLRVRES